MIPRLHEIVSQEQSKNTLTRWVEWMFVARPGVRRYDRYTEKRFNVLTGKVE